MAGKKDRSVVAVITGLTKCQEANISRDIMLAKQKHAPLGRGIISQGSSSSIGSRLKQGQKRIGR